MKSLIKKILLRVKVYSLKKKNEPLIPLVYQALSSGLEYSSIRTAYKLSSTTLDDFIIESKCFEFKRLNSLQTLSLSHDIKSFIKDFNQKLVKVLLYPISLILISILLLFFYGYKFGPNLVVMLGEFLNTNSILNQIYVIRFLAVFSLILIIVLMVLFALLSIGDISIILYTFMCNYEIFDVFKEYITYMFSICLLFILKLEVSTVDSIRELRSLKQLRYVSWLSYHIDENLEEGSNIMGVFSSKYLSSTFSLLVVQGLISDDLLGSIQNYCDLALVSIDSKVKRIGSIVKLISYVVIVAIIALFYSGLFKPLSILEGLI